MSGIVPSFYATLLSMSLATACSTGELALRAGDPTPSKDVQLNRDIISCSTTDGRARCSMPAERSEGRTQRFRLRATRSDLKKYGLTTIGWNVCAISDRRGYHCTDLETGMDATSTHAKPMRDRSWVAWNDGLCVESSRTSSRSRFECFHRSGRVRQTTDFFISRHHRTASFDSGMCVCSDQREPFQDDGEPPIGAVCLFHDDDVEASPPYEEREADSLTQALMMRGPYFYLDFGAVCSRIEGSTPAEAKALLHGWQSGRTDLPPTIAWEPEHPGPQTVVEIPSSMGRDRE